MHRFYINTGKLIGEVRQRPVIWDVSHAQYKVKNERVSAWREICSVVISGYENLKPTAKKDAFRACQQRWKTARDAYKRRIKSKKYGKYGFHKDLTFLESNTSRTPGEVQSAPAPASVARQCGETGLLGSVSTLGTIGSVRTLGVLSSASTRPDGPHSDNSSGSPRPILKPHTSAKLSRDNTNKPTREFYNDIISIIRDITKPDDDNLAFFRSLLPTLSQFNNHQKLFFRSEVLKVAMAIMRDSQPPPACDDGHVSPPQESNSHLEFVVPKLEADPLDECDTNPDETHGDWENTSINC